ncbi:MAG: bile acid:sodium symporter family protein, partial [Acidobacteriota bacterium]
MLLLGSIDDVTINFSETSLLILGFVLAIIMFGIALDTKIDDFREVTRLPKAMAVGVGAQFIALPAITFCLTLLLGVGPSIALGMILVACCPPGNISNVLTYRAKGNVALSVSMTAISNLLAIFLMPLNIAFWGGLHPGASEILEAVDLNALELLGEIALIIAVPFAIGITIAERRPDFAAKTQPWVKRFSLIALLVFVIIAFFSNFANFREHIAIVALAVFLHDSLA